jgi:hypothetical protein
MPTTKRRVLVVAVFQSDALARQAVDSLLESGVGSSEVGLAFRRGELTHAAGALAAIDVPEHDIAGGLVGLGVPFFEARDYSQEFERCRTIVTVEPRERLAETAFALRDRGALSIQMWVPPHRD